MKNQFDVALAALNHPQGLAILNSLCRLTGQDREPSSVPDKTADFKIQAESKADLPRSSELRAYGVDLKDQRLLQVALQNSLRTSSAINAWLKWATYTDVEYPTLSLIRAIEQNWTV